LFIIHFRSLTRNAPEGKGFVLSHSLMINFNQEKAGEKIKKDRIKKLNITPALKQVAKPSCALLRINIITPPSLVRYYCAF